MFLAAASISTVALYFWRQILLAIVVMLVLVHGFQLFAMPFVWVENTFGDTSRVERAIAPIDGGWRVYVWNRTDRIVRRARVECRTGMSSYIERDIAPGETYEGIVSYQDTSRKGCDVEWEFFRSHA